MLILAKLFTKKVCQKKKASYLCTRFEGQCQRTFYKD